MFARISALAVSTLFIATAACAQLYTPPGKDISSAPAGKYTLDPAHATVMFMVNHLGYSWYIGKFTEFDATIMLDPKAPEKSTLSVNINPASIHTGNEKLEGELRSAQVFHTDKFNKITFTSTNIEKVSAVSGKVTGNLDMAGVTKPLTLNVTLNGSGTQPMTGKPTIGFSATGALKRSDWGLTAWTPMVGDEVKLVIEAEFNKVNE